MVSKVLQRSNAINMKGNENENRRNIPPSTPRDILKHTTYSGKIWVFTFIFQTI
jgi:hypothetical protein